MTEIRNVCSKGLCYYCDQPYDRNQKCLFKESQLFTVEIAKNDEKREDSDEDIDSQKEELGEPVISINALSGSQTFHTMRVQGMRHSLYPHSMESLTPR